MRRIYVFPFLLVILFVLQGCEKIGTDDVPPISTDPTETGRTQKVFYTYQNDNIAIDIKQLITSLGTKSLKISSLPTYGNATFLPEGILTYTPDEDITEADDQLEIAYEQQNGAIVQEKVVIKIVAENFDLPCITNAMPDRAKTETNKAVTINVLDNDVFCDGTLKNIDNITILPINGTAVVVGKNITYTPKQGFKGEDKLVYAVTILNSKGKEEKRFAFVKIDVAQPNLCSTKLRNDIVNFKFQSPKDSLLIKALNNDNICPSDKILGAVNKLEIAKQPRFGKAKVINNSAISYKLVSPLPPPNGTPFLDSIVYKLTVPSGVHTATVFIKEEKNVQNCKPTVDNNTFFFQVNKLTGKDFVEVDVLKNSFLCPNTKVEKIDIVYLNKEKNGTLTKTNEEGVVRYIPSNKIFKAGEDVIFSYEILDSKGLKAIGISKIKFVD
jgi:hypothetical protein